MIGISELLVQLVVAALRELGMELHEQWIRDREWQRANPCPTSVAFGVLSKTLPRWRVLARAIARSKARRFEAWCIASERCRELTASATDMVRARLAELPNKPTART